MSPVVRLSLAAGLASGLSCWALSPMYEGLGWLLPTLAAVLVVALAGLAARAARVPALLVPLLQLAAVALLAALLYLPGALSSPAAARLALELLVLDAQVGVRELAPPVPTRDELVLLAVLGAGAVATLVDLLAVGLRRAALAGLPLLVLLAVPSGLVEGGLGWLPFTLGAAGWLVLLHVEGDLRVDRWGAALPSAPRASADTDPDSSSGRAGRRIGAAALGVAAVVPALLPGLDARLLPGSDGPGADGERTTITYNPITRLQGELTRPDPQAVLRYETSDPFPDYLRLTTLDLFDGGGWRSSSLSGEDVEDGIAPPAAAVDLREVVVRAELGGYLDSQWLPVPALPREVDVDGRWLWDADAETVFSVTSNTQRIDGYRAEVSRRLPDRAVLEAATTLGPPDERYAEPVPVSPAVQDLVRQVVRDAPTPYEQAVALQQHFLDGGFTYDETAPAAVGRDPLSYFLLESRRGFCEQFASAMGAMLRVLGIPSRVAVGFTPGVERTDGERLVTTDDAHAWPEAWFDGIGWVRFEPTPTGDGRTDVPAHTEEEREAPLPDGSAPTPTAAPLPTASTAPGTSGRDLDQLDRQDDDSAVVGGGDGGALAAARGAAGVLGAGLVLAAPAALAGLRRRRRWREPGALAAWEQLREDATDLGHPWSVADSPRGAAARLAEAVALPGVAADALGRLARAAERARYSRDGSLGELTPDGLRVDVVLVREALQAAAPRGQRLRARLAPPSTLRWAATSLGSRTADLLDRVDDVLGALPRRLRRSA